MQLERDVFRALCAVVWADGKIVPAESAAMLAAASAAELSDAEIAEVRAMLASPTTLEALGPLELDPERAEYVYALACMLSATDGLVDPRERAVMSALGDRLGLSDEARERAAAASLAVAERLGIPSSNRGATLEALARSIAARD